MKQTTNQLYFHFEKQKDTILISMKSIDEGM